MNNGPFFILFGFHFYSTFFRDHTWHNSFVLIHFLTLFWKLLLSTPIIFFLANRRQENGQLAVLLFFCLGCQNRTQNERKKNCGSSFAKQFWHKDKLVKYPCVRHVTGRLCRLREFWNARFFFRRARHGTQVSTTHAQAAFQIRSTCLSPWWSQGHPGASICPYRCSVRGKRRWWNNI